MDALFANIRIISTSMAGLIELTYSKNIQMPHLYTSKKNQCKNKDRNQVLLKRRKMQNALCEIAYLFLQKNEILP